MKKSFSNRVRDAFAIAVVTVMTSPAVYAQGATTAASNLTNFFRVLTTVIIAACVAGGLGTIAYGAFQMVKKGDQRGEDITWMSIGLKFAGGAFLLALGWVATMILETLGGSAGNIGRNVI